MPYLVAMRIGCRLQSNVVTNYPSLFLFSLSLCHCRFLLLFSLLSLLFMLFFLLLSLSSSSSVSRILSFPSSSSSSSSSSSPSSFFVFFFSLSSHSFSLSFTFAGPINTSIIYVQVVKFGHRGDSPTHSKGGLGGGSIFLVIFLSCATAYLGIGIGIQKRKGASG